MIFAALFAVIPYPRHLVECNNFFPTYYPAMSVTILCGQKFPSPILLKLHSAGESNVPEASRKPCAARPSGVSVSGGWCGTPSEAKVGNTTQTPRAASTGHHPE